MTGEVGDPVARLNGALEQAEVLGGAIHFATFDVSTHYPLVRGMQIDFVARTRGDYQLRPFGA